MPLNTRDKCRVGCLFLVSTWIGEQVVRTGIHDRTVDGKRGMPSDGWSRAMDPAAVEEWWAVGGCQGAHNSASWRSRNSGYQGGGFSSGTTGVHGDVVSSPLDRR